MPMQWLYHLVIIPTYLYTFFMVITFMVLNTLIRFFKCLRSIQNVIKRRNACYVNAVQNKIETLRYTYGTCH